MGLVTTFLQCLCYQSASKSMLRTALAPLVMLPRDNVIFELGLFVGAIGRRRTFGVYDTDKPIKIPSDLAGVTMATFRGDRPDKNLDAAVSPACSKIMQAIEQLGLHNE